MIESKNLLYAQVGRAGRDRERSQRANGCASVAVAGNLCWSVQMLCWIVDEAWAKKSGIPVSQTRELSKRFLGAPLTETRNAPSLSRVMNDHIDDGKAGRLDDGWEDLFDLDPEPEEFDEIKRESLWVLSASRNIGALLQSPKEASFAATRNKPIWKQLSD